MTAHPPVRRHWLQAKTSSSFIARFILLVIAPLKRLPGLMMLNIA